MSSERAQANSVAQMPSPRKITNHPGPGSDQHDDPGDDHDQAGHRNRDSPEMATAGPAMDECPNADVVPAHPFDEPRPTARLLA